MFLRFVVQLRITGQLWHSGLRTWQTVAPNSMSDWLSDEQSSVEQTKVLASDQSLIWVALSFGFLSIPKMRVSIRVTLPSTMGSGRPKAMLLIAPVV